MEGKERLVPWEPIGNERSNTTRMLPSDWVAEYDVMVSQPSPNGETRRFRFDEVLAFRPPSEAVRLMLVESSSNTLCTTFKVEDSEWVKLFHEQTYGAFREGQIQHFVFLSDVIVEVLSADEPWIVETQRPSQ